MSKYQTPEGHYVKGSGIEVDRSEVLRTTFLSVTDEEMATNPLVRNWVEAIKRAADTAQTEIQLRREGLL